MLKICKNSFKQNITPVSSGQYVPEVGTVVICYVSSYLETKVANVPYIKIL